MVKKISGKGVQKGGFLIPQNKIDQLITYKHLLTTKQKKDILIALQTGSGVHIKPTKVQKDDFLGTLLASIGIPLVFDTLKSLTGSGAPQMGLPRQRLPGSLPKQTESARNNQDGGLVLPYDYRSPPFIGSWPDQTIGLGTKKRAPKKRAPPKKAPPPKKKKSSEKGQRSPPWQKFTLQKRPTVKHSVVKPRFHKNIPLSNYDLIDWCKYLNIPIKDVLSRDKTVPYNHQQALFIYNLEPSYMSGSHWVATYVKDNVINYFDSFGLPHFKK